MANNFSFSTAGSTPQTPQLPGLGGGGYTPSTSAAKALSTAMGGYQAPKPTIPSAPPAPQNQQVKKTTLNLPDGSSHITEYHPGVFQPSPVAPTTPPPTTFSGTVDKLADTSSQGSATGQEASKDLSQTPAGTPATQGYIGKTADYGAGNIAIEQKAQDIADQYGKQIADVGGQGARFETGQLATGTSPVAEGNAAVTAQTTAAQQEALAKGESAALEGTAQQLTGQNQAANAANAAAGESNTAQGTQVAGQTAAGNIANTGQATKQSGLLGAGNLAQPQLGNIGQVPYSPTDLSQGSPLGAPGGSAADAARVAGNFQGAQAAAAASGTAAAHNIGAAGTASTDANNKIYQDAATASAGFKTAQNNINNLGNNILQFMSTNPGINNLGARVLDSKLNDLQTQLNDPQYSQFNSQIAGLQRAISQYIQAGEIPTASTAAAKSIADGSIDLKALAGALQGINTDLDAAAKAQDTTAAYAQQQMQSSANAFPSSGQGGGGGGWASLGD